MICPAVIRTNHGPCDVHVTAIPGSYNDIVNEVPLFGAGMSPRCLKFVFLTKESISDDEIMFNTIAEKHNSTSVAVSDAFLSYSALPEVLIPANPGIEISKKKNRIFLGDSRQCLV